MKPPLPMLLLALRVWMLELQTIGIFTNSFRAELFSNELVQGAGESDEGLAAFARAVAPRAERIRQRYSQESQSQASSDDEHDDYGMDIWGGHTLRQHFSISTYFL